MNNEQPIIDHTSVFEHAVEAVEVLAKRLPETLRRPRLGIICGSGLGGLADSVLTQPRHEIPYAAIPHFPIGSGIRTKVAYKGQARCTDLQQCMATLANLSLGC